MHPTIQQHCPREAGFTLIEVMVVIAIIGLLTTMVIANLGDNVDDARTQRVNTDLTSIASAVKLYHMKKGELPSMAALMTPDNEDRTYMDDPSLDPWDEPYSIHPGDSKRTFLVVCAGPDKVVNTEDDIKKKARW